MAIGNIESMDIDGRQVTLHLSSFRSDMLYNLAACFIGVIDKDQLDSMDQDELMWGAVPYGQYSVESYEPGTEVVLVPNEGYSTDNPLVENKGVGKMSSIKVKFSKEEFTEAGRIKKRRCRYHLLSLHGRKSRAGRSRRHHDPGCNVSEH